MEDLIEYLILGVLLWVGFQIIVLMVRAKDISNHVADMRTALAEKIRVIKLETYNESVILAYDSENNDFLGQGNSIDELKKCIIERFPTKIFILNDKVFSATKIEALEEL